MNYRATRFLKIFAFVVLAAGVLGVVLKELWNWLMPGLFGLHAITFVQALGLLLLSKILFGGFRRGGGPGRRWKQHMKSRMENMSEEERERFRAGMRGCRWGGPRRDAEPVAGGQ